MNDLDRHFAHVNGQVRKHRIVQKGICGLGTNDAHWRVQWYEGKQLISADPAHAVWKSLLQRCEVGGVLQIKRPTYVGCGVCDAWCSYLDFTSWWRDNQVDGWCLDKDLVVFGNKQYGPDTCIFVPNWVNTFTVDRGGARGRYPIGVHKQGRKYEAQVSNTITKINERLGFFRTPEAAHEAWQTRKLELALERKPDMDAIDPRIYTTVVQKIVSA
jgi:hypothetical protein